MNPSLITLLVQKAFVVFATLTPIINAPGMAPIFLSLTEELPAQSRNRVAREIAVSGFLLVIGSVVIGSPLLAFFGVSVPALRVGGGMLVTATAWQLLRSDHPRPLVGPFHEKATQEGASTGAVAAFYPLTFPLTVGPGTISMSMTLGVDFRGTHLPLYIGLVALVIGAALAAVVIYLSYRFAGVLTKTLGETGTIVFLRLASFILLCIGIQIGWEGLSELIQSVHTAPAANSR
ncbi:MAG TPA: MarC family protein [Chthoniobacterales bacterium]|nr:MarC family protein [Chthoniobacterales bacterium]